MPVIRYPDGTEVYTAEDAEEPKAHLRRGRFDRSHKTRQTERQRLEDGLKRMASAAKSFFLDDDEDDIAVAARMLDKATGKKLSE
jgi:hypothetical protein